MNIELQKHQIEGPKIEFKELITANDVEHAKDIVDTKLLPLY